MSDSSALPPPPISSVAPFSEEESGGPGALSVLRSYLTLNFGGPGWISDVFDVEAEFDGGVPMVVDNGAKFTIPWTSWKGQAPMYQRDSVVSGSITVRAPELHSVTANAVKVRVEEYVCLLDPFVTNDLGVVEGVVAAKPIVIEGERVFKFELEMSSVQGWKDDYIGSMFAIKHALVIEIERPWWTFNVMHYEALAVYHQDPAPVDGGNIGRREMTESEIDEAIANEVRANELFGEDVEDEEEIRSRFMMAYKEEMGR